MSITPINKINFTQWFKNHFLTVFWTYHYHSFSSFPFFAYIFICKLYKQSIFIFITFIFFLTNCIYFILFCGGDNSHRHAHTLARTCTCTHTCDEVKPKTSPFLHRSSFEWTTKLYIHFFNNFSFNLHIFIVHDTIYLLNYVVHWKYSNFYAVF